MSDPSSIQFAFIATMLLIFGAYAFHEYWRGQLIIFEPLTFFWTGIFVIYVLEIFTNFDAYLYEYGPGPLTDALLCIIFSIIFVHVGYSLHGVSIPSRLVAKLPPVLDRDKLALIGYGLTAAGFAAWTYQIAASGGLSAWSSVARGGEDWNQISAYVAQIASLFTIGISILLLRCYLYESGWLLRTASWFLWCSNLLLFVYIGSRSRTIALVLTALMAIYLPSRRRPSVVLVVLTAVSLLLVSNFIANYRDNFRNLSFNLESIDWSEVPARIVPGISDYASRNDAPFSRGSELGVTISTISLVPRDVPYAFGGEFLQLFTHAIPRAWWPEKSYPRSELWSEIHFRAQTTASWAEDVKVPFLMGPAPGFTASWYYNGGILGLVIGGVLTGFLLRAIREMYTVSSSNHGLLIVYFVVSPIGFSEAVTHPLLWLYSLPLILAPLLVLLNLARRSVK